ncbi:MAG: nucleotide sugar dehydrogenase [Deltaproteobacteria bacterium]|nr:MAG: nucleotide sugar dehydrogenase [Deltaproteobacteria bacterium]
MVTLESIKAQKDKIAVVGLGYVGLPLAVAFARKVQVLGFDISERKVRELLAGVDSTGEVNPAEFPAMSLEFTTEPSTLSGARFIIVTVPTPIDENKSPDLTPVISATRMIGENLSRGSIIVFESTVYPGVTEEVCVPILEEMSGLSCGVDFKVGYSPERINPGDKVHTVDKIVKVVAGMDEDALNVISSVYGIVVNAGVHRATTIKAAEAAKVIENTQRDINIALMNELAIIFDRLGINTKDVLAAAGTKWNFLNFTPGLVGGHCISVDPYYLTFKAQAVGYNPEVVLAGRRINDSMGKYVAEKTIKLLIKNSRVVQGSKVLILGLTFKENVPDIRNTKVMDIVRELEQYGVKPLVNDPHADSEETRRIYGIDLVNLQEVEGVDAIILAVAHDAYREVSTEALLSLAGNDNGRGVVVDVKGFFSSEEVEKRGLTYWSL